NTPSDDGGSPITSYTVTSYPGGSTATGTGSPIVVTGLNRQAPYTFTVHATNAAGNSPESAPSNAVQTVFVPDRPAIVSTVGGDGSATVTFTPPVSDGGRPITRYTAIARPGAAVSGPGITASGTGSPLTIGGLTNGTLYAISVYATNALGNGPEAVSYVVEPLGLPSAPTGVGAAVSPLGMSVAFTPPRATGGAPVTGYTVTSSPGGITATGTTSPIMVTGLTNGVSYTFTAHATTSAGNGPESAPSNAVTWVNSTALSPPLYPSAAAGNQQATVSFLPPLDDGGSPVTSYTVTSSPGGITATGTTSPIVVCGLTNGVSYTFAVIAATAKGTSQPSQSNAVTPSASYGPPNDDFANAQPISGTSGAVTGANVSATKESGEPDHDGDPGGASVWYVWTAPANVGGSVTFDTCGSNFSTLLAAYQGGAVGALSQDSTLLPGNAPGCSAGGRTIRFDVPYSGGTFYIAVDGASSSSGPATGNIVLHWTQSV
ncbi:MAG: fibronectin type III domain-containing protein, partial [Chloroflexota bacterium]|nr:fibronectin type III domain-containing protein [Chloroflexota bacterium]